MDLYAEASEECHEHLREVDKKRDQTLAFYAVLVGILFSSIKNLGPFGSVVTLAIALVGTLLALVLINYRKWHLILVNATIVLQYLRRQKHPASSSSVREAWRSLITSPSKARSAGEMINPFMSTEAAIFDAFLVVSALPWYAIIREAQWAVEIPTRSDALAFLVNLILYVAAFNVLLVVILDKSDKRAEKAFWLFRLDSGQEMGAGMVPPLAQGPPETSKKGPAPS